MKPATKKIAGVAVAISIGIGGAITVDQTQPTIPLECDVQTEKITDLNTKLHTYKIDEGFIKTRNIETTEKRTIKGCEIAKSLTEEKIVRTNYEIEIVDTQPIENGVEVFARAWRDGKQIGFGKDGTVDIERFRFINPPILVDDVNGDIVKKWEEVDVITGDITSKTKVFREDPKEALIQALERTISKIENESGNKQIEPNKRGNTITTIYSEVGDGHMRPLNDGGSNWATVNGSPQNGTNGQTVNPTGLTSFTRAIRFSGDNRYYIYRSWYCFDLSSIPSEDTITSANFVVVTGGGVDTGTDIYLTEGTQDSCSTLVSADNDEYENTSFGNVVINATLGGVNTIALNAAGLSHLSSKSATTKFALRESHDVTGVAPTDGNPGFVGYTSEQTGTTNDPSLVIEHTAPLLPPTPNVELINGVYLKGNIRIY